MGAGISRFAFADCATCDGRGTTKDLNPCQPCHGKGRILIMLPSTLCPRCRGTGKTEPGAMFSSDYCLICFGTGYLWTEFHLSESIVRKAAAGLVDSGRGLRTVTTR